MVQWLRLCSSNVGAGRGVVVQIPAWGTRIPQAMMHSQKKKVATLSEGSETIHIMEEKNNRRTVLFQARQHTKAMNVQRGIYVPIIKAILQAKIFS